jgi:hypothetical protein
MRIDRRKFLRAAAGMPTYTATTFGLLSGISGSIALAGLEEKDGELVEAWLDAAKVVGDRTAVGTLLLTRFVERIYALMKPIGWKPGPQQDQSLPHVQVPMGFVTDFASVPRLFWTALPPDGDYTYAAILHDYLYWNQATDKATADLVLKAAMEDFGVSAAQAFAVYNGVKVGGQSAWDGNAALKAAGEKRVLKVFPTDPTVRWKTGNAGPVCSARRTSLELFCLSMISARKRVPRLSRRKTGTHFSGSSSSPRFALLVVGDRPVLPGR